MPESSEEKIARLVQEGLDHYGFGDISDAILAWKQVLAIEPDHPQARDYIKTADRRSFPRPEDADQSARAKQQKIAQEARALIRAGSLEPALDLLRSATEDDRFDLEIEATIELVRSRLLRDYRESIGDLSAVPVLVADPAQIAKFNLPPDAGFLIAAVDESTSLSGLISISGMDSFEVLRTTKSLLEAGILRMQT